MGIHMTSQEDFFLYVSATQEAERALHSKLGEDLDLPLGNDAWLRIPLTGEIVVYAHMLDDDDKMAN